MKYLRPFILKESYYQQIEDCIQRIFNDIIFKPLMLSIAQSGWEITNAASIGLETALARGDVYYFDGRIHGRFNASISKELKGMGATFDKRSSSWKLPGALPARLQMIVARRDAQVKKTMDAVITTLDTIQIQKNEVSYQEELQEYYGNSLWRMNKDFLEATKQITVVPEFTDAQRQTLAKDYSQNLDLYIQDWCSEAITTLREDVYTNVIDGQRSGNMIKMIEKEYGVSQEKAKFLARQETSLLMSKMRESRYADVGIYKYVWRGSMDAREREDHKVLEGTIQDFRNPPITCRTGKNAGARNNPGEDFGPCRCLAIPILE